MNTSSASGQVEFSGSKTKRWLILTFSYAVAAACLYWVFHGISFHDWVESMRGVSWGWVLPAIGFDLLVYVFAGWEWQLLVQPVGRLSFRHAFQAVFASRFANDVLPVHAGYIVRIFLTARSSGCDIAPLISSLLVERTFDVFWLVLGIGLTTLFFPLPHEVARAGVLLGAGLLASLALIAWLLARRRHPGPGRSQPNASRWKPIEKLSSFLDHLSQGLREVGRPSVIAAAFGLSVVKLGCFCAAFLLLLRAYGFSFSVWVDLAVFLIAYAGISLPSTPAGIGVFQLICAAGLRFFGTPRLEASSFSLLAYIVLTVPLTIAGFFAAAQSGLTLTQVRREVAAWRTRAA
ncbi:MAG TPA: lysylphosphatidylglycerol synthase transmembrane domain-containing protein [Verrucomicrobiae bacterium]|nr:lysylphosphatidylglycerol synthase transmembrane domain-containing protein [Verrucomicrobiae bacterium]